MTCKQFERILRKTISYICASIFVFYTFIIGTYGWFFNYNTTPEWIKVASIIELMVILFLIFLLFGSWLSGEISFCKDDDEQDE